MQTTTDVFDVFRLARVDGGRLSPAGKWMVLNYIDDPAARLALWEYVVIARRMGNDALANIVAYELAAADAASPLPEGLDPRTTRVALGVPEDPEMLRDAWTAIETTLYLFLERAVRLPGAYRHELRQVYEAVSAAAGLDPRPEVSADPTLDPVATLDRLRAYFQEAYPWWGDDPFTVDQVIGVLREYRQVLDERNANDLA